MYKVNLMCVLPASKTPDDDVDAPVDKKDDATLIGTEEIGHILDSKGTYTVFKLIVNTCINFAYYIFTVILLFRFCLS